MTIKVLSRCTSFGLHLGQPDSVTPLGMSGGYFTGNIIFRELHEFIWMRGHCTPGVNSEYFQNDPNGGITPTANTQWYMYNLCFIINICMIPYAFPALLITYQNIIQYLFSMEFHGTYNFPQKCSMEFYGIPWNFLKFGISMELDELDINKKIIFLNIVVGIWLMIICYLAKISQ